MLILRVGDCAVVVFFYGSEVQGAFFGRVFVELAFGALESSVVCR